MNTPTPTLDLIINKLPNKGKCSALEVSVEYFNVLKEMPRNSERSEAIFSNQEEIKGYLLALRDLNKIGSTQYDKAERETRKLTEEALGIDTPLRIKSRSKKA